MDATAVLHLLLKSDVLDADLNNFKFVVVFIWTDRF